MNLKTKKLSHWVASVAIAVVAPLAHANFVNPGFSGNVADNPPSGWTTSINNVLACTWQLFAPTHNNGTGAQPAGADGSAANPYDLAAEFACETGDGTLSQALAPNAGGYMVDFWQSGHLGTGATLDTGLSSLTLLGSQTVTDEFLGADFVWDHYSGFLAGNGFFDVFFSLTVDSPATLGQSTLLMFDDFNAVAANNIPEPGTLLLVGAALAAGAMVRRKKQV